MIADTLGRDERTEEEQYLKLTAKRSANILELQKN